MQIASKTALVVSTVALASAALTGALSWRQTGDVLEQAILDRQALVASQSSSALFKSLDFARKELASLSTMVAVDLDDDDPRPEQRLVTEAYRLTPFFFNAGVALVDSAGRCHAAVPRSCETTVVGPDWVRVGRSADGPLITFDGEAALAGRNVRLLVPIRDEKGALHGVMQGEISLRREDLFEQPTGGSDARPVVMSVVSTAGDVLHHEGDPLLRGIPWSQPPADAGARAWTQIVDGEVFVLATCGVGDLPMRLVHAWRWKDLDTRAETRVKTFVLSFLIACLFGLAVGVLASRALTRPLLRLAHDVGRTQREQASLPRGDGGDEVATLRVAFADLVDQLREREQDVKDDRDRIADLAATLEQRVEERTTKLEAAQDALVEAERMAALGQAGAALSHELRNSLNGLSVGFDAMGGSLSEQATTRIRQELRREIARLRTLADTLLDFARPRELQATAISLPTLVDRCVATVEVLIEERGIELRVDLPEVQVTVDSDLLVSVVTNLLHNAVDAVAHLDPARRVVAVAATTDAEAWTLTIEDAGPGIPEAIRSRLFQPFVSGRSGGVGLGLAIARQFTQLHGGTLEVGASELGGARFAVSIPHGTVDDMQRTT